MSDPNPAKPPVQDNKNKGIVTIDLKKLGVLPEKQLKNLEAISKMQKEITKTLLPIILTLQVKPSALTEFQKLQKSIPDFYKTVSAIPSLKVVPIQPHIAKNIILSADHVRELAYNIVKTSTKLVKETEEGLKKEKNEELPQADKQLIENHINGLKNWMGEKFDDLEKKVEGEGEITRNAWKDAFKDKRAIGIGILLGLIPSGIMGFIFWVLPK